MESTITQNWKKALTLAAKEASSVHVIADSNLPEEYSFEVLELCKAESRTQIINFKGGEDVKTLSNVSEIYLHLDKFGADRKSLVVCLGGGTITDLGGFAASTYQRGLKLAHLPTTVLAMVDAAIGGKTGVNTEMQKNVGLLKNQIGTFYNPIMVGINYDWLKSLDKSEVLSGWGEMVKHALLEGGEYLERFIKVSPSLNNISPLIMNSARIKEAIVKRDEKENGERASLNLGHTIAHAIESLAHDEAREIKHGVAVAWGLVFALDVSVEKMGLDRSKAKRLQGWIVSGMSEGLYADEANAVWNKMSKDKKNTKGNVTDVLICENGEIVWDFVWERKEFTILWEQFLERHV